MIRLKTRNEHLFFMNYAVSIFYYLIEIKEELTNKQTKSECGNNSH